MTRTQDPLAAKRAEPSPRTHARLVTAALYLLELSAAIALLALYKGQGWPFEVFLRMRMGVVFVGALLVLVAAALFILVQARARRFSLRSILALNALSLLVMFVTAEVALRVLATPTATGPSFAGQELLPRSWSDVASHNRALLARADTQPTFLVSDSVLGWTVGASRQSGDYNAKFQQRFVADLRARFPSRDSVPDPKREIESISEAIYLSSTEGIRSARAGISFADLPAGRRIALIGNSFTFGLEVRYEQTWGAQLEQLLGGAYQVLNFGVDGYGVDQAYLRYLRDVKPWQPDIVILGVIDDDFRRTMCVYAFLCFNRSEMPFAKPRFLLQGGELRQINAPLPTQDQIFSGRSIARLPDIEHDRSFDPVEWESTPLHAAWSVRYLLSRYRRYQPPDSTVTDEALKQVNGALLRAFVRRVRESGALPMVVYFPARTYAGPETVNPPSVAREVLQSIGVPYSDMTACLAPIEPADRFAVVHYSAAANAAIAQCLRAPVAARAAEARRAAYR